MIQLRMMVLAMTIGVGCGGPAGPPAAPAGGAATASLYDRLGKRDAIAAVVKDFVEERVAKDDRINAFFKTTDLADLEAKLIDQICEASGGPCTYKGKDMKVSHAGLGITDSDFTAIVEDLEVSLDHFKVAAKDQRDLLGALAPMHDDIVTAK